MHHAGAFFYRTDKLSRNEINRSHLSIKFTTATKDADFLKTFGLKEVLLSIHTSHSNMEIKDAIGQSKPFRNSRHKAIVNVLFSNGWLIAQLRALFKPFGITEKQYNILRILNGSDTPLSTSVIRNRLLDKMSDTTRVIDRMIKKELVSKTINEKDRRLVDITLSTKGKTLLDQVDAKIQMDEIVDGLSHEEAEVLSSLLDKMRDEK